MQYFRLFLISVCLAFPAAADYTTYIGDVFAYNAAAIATDAAGNTYVTGSRLITSPNPNSSLTDVFVSKLDPSGNVTLLATLSGKASDRATAIALDTTGNIYIAGATTSPDFPLFHPLQTSIFEGPFFPSPAGPSGSTGTAFLVKLNPSGTIIYSTLLGGTAGPSNLNAVAADAQGNAYATGETFASDYQRTPGLPAGSAAPGPTGTVSAAFFAKISPLGEKIVYAGGIGAASHACTAGSSCFLSALYTTGVSIAVDSAGDAWLAGNTQGLGLPVTTGAFQTNGVGAFVAKVNAAGSGLSYLTSLSAVPPGPVAPGAFNAPTLASSLAVDSAGNAYIAGSTSDPAFPATASAFQTTLSGVRSPDAFVAKLNPTGTSLVWATFLGGAAADGATAIALAPSGNVWISGTTQSADFPVSSGAPHGPEFLAAFNPSGSSLTSGLRLPVNTAAASLAIDSTGVVHAAGATGMVSTFTPSQLSAPRVLGVTNAATGNLTGRLAPAELISIYGLNLGPQTPVSATFNSSSFLPTSLGGLQVTINGAPAPLLYVSNDQINAVSPTVLTGVANTGIPALLAISGTSVPSLRLLVDKSDPAVFGQPFGFAAALNEDGTVNSQSNPAKAGSIVSIWATGIGIGTPGLADGQEQTAAQTVCSCAIYNLAQNTYIYPIYAGAAPGMVNGIVQINFQLAGPFDYYTISDRSHLFMIWAAP